MVSVLVVDDEADIRDLLAFRLLSLGHEVYLEADGDAGLAAALVVRPRVILLDWEMPFRSGLEVCSELRARHEFDRTGIFLLSARCQQDDIQRGLACGADDYLVKPFTLKAVVARIESHVADAARCDQSCGAA